MVHTLPDYTTQNRMTTIFGQIDQGELAARLGTINTFDRRGDTAWMEDFEAATLAWAAVAIGTGSNAGLSAASFLNGGQSLELLTGSTITFQAQATRHLHLPVQTKIGFECSFTTDADLSYFLMGVTLYDGTNLQSAAIFYDHANDHLDYLNSGNTYTQFAAGTNFNPNIYLYNPLKFVIDYSTGKYIRAIFGQTEYDLSNISFYSTADATAPAVSIQLVAIGTTGNNAVVYVDNVIFTQNEP